MDTPRYTITRDHGPTPWTIARSTAAGGVYIIGRCETHADAVDALDWLLPSRAHGHTLVVTEDPAAARRALKARRMAARRRARRSAPLSAWESTPARLEGLAAVYASMARSAREATRADFTLAAPSGDA